MSSKVMPFRLQATDSVQDVERDLPNSPPLSRTVTESRRAGAGDSHQTLRLAFR